MIATVTANTALDRLLFVPRFSFGRRIVAENCITTMGGKGTNVSILVKTLGAKTMALGFAAGLAGAEMLKMLAEHQIPFDFVQAEGETRVNTVIVDKSTRSQSTIIAETMWVTEDQEDVLIRKVREAADQAKVWCFCGSLPRGSRPEAYALMIEAAKDAGAVTILDTSGEALRRGITAKPTYIKPNLFELEELVGRTLGSVDHVVDAVKEVLDAGPEWVVASLGEQGIVAATKGATYFVPPLDVQVVSTSGGGDGIVAGIALGIERQVPPEAGLRLGAAVAASVVMSPGTAQCNPDDVVELFRKTRLERLD
ncbi:MAG: 1-phosphofructokinase family hexose kinase [Armatimonadota bacterium]